MGFMHEDPWCFNFRGAYEHIMGVLMNWGLVLMQNAEDSEGRGSKPESALDRILIKFGAAWLLTKSGHALTVSIEKNQILSLNKFPFLQKLEYL